VKEALFNILAGDVSESRWWDLFAGTGAVGIEALSRGAAFVRFSDRERAAVETVRANLEHCRLSERAEVRRGDAFRMLHAAPDDCFDYVYIAPPQYHALWSRALQDLDDHPDWLSSESWVIVQIAPREYQTLDLKALVEFDRRKYGTTLLVFHQRKESGA
jgi:16S rRNA (guanine(966)-N(2))-methyltransferase RsmD